MEKCTEDERKKRFAPVHIRIALDEREGNVEKKRLKAYEILSQYGAHATYRGFRITTPKDSLGLVGPFVDETILRAFIEELALRIGPAAILYGSLFPALPENIRKFGEKVSVELVEALKQ